MIVLQPDDKVKVQRIAPAEETVPAEAERGRIRLMFGDTHVVISQRQAHSLRAQLQRLKLDKIKE